MTTKTLEPQDLDQFTGTETWYRHPLNKKLLYTDGVMYFAEQAGAHWFVDLIAVGANGNPGPVPQAIPDQDRFGVVLLKVTGSTAQVQVRTDYDENDATVGTALYKEPIPFTDCPEGTWKFYLMDDGTNTVLMVPSEY
jgi:hypothetical protein